MCTRQPEARTPAHHPPGPSPARVFVVDDHFIVREGLRRLIEREPSLLYCGAASTVEEAQRGIIKVQPSLVVLDLFMGGRGGLELLAWLQEHAPKVRALVLSMHDETLYADRVLRLGARGYVMKDETETCLVKALHRVAEGHLFLSEAMTERVLERASGSHPEPAHELDVLTDRELQVFELIGQGSATTRIARTLGRSVKTIESHRANIKQKLGIAGAAEFMQRAVVWVESPMRPESTPGA